MRIHSSIVALLGFSLFGTSCTADLADGNPCRALVHSLCDHLAECGLFSGTADDCIHAPEYDDYKANCGYDTGVGRACGSAISSSSCEAAPPKDACADVFTRLDGHALHWAKGRPLQGSGGTSNGATSGTSGSSGKSSGSTGDGAGGAGACFDQVESLIEVASIGNSVFDYTATQSDFTPYECLIALVWPEGGRAAEPAATTKPQKFYYTSSAPSPRYVYNVSFDASFSPRREGGFTAGKWKWGVYSVYGVPGLGCPAATGNESRGFVKSVAPEQQTPEYDLPQGGFLASRGEFSIECGQLPFVSRGTVQLGRPGQP